MSLPVEDLETAKTKLDLQSLRILIRRLWPYLWRHKGLFFLAATLVVASTLTNLTLPWLLGYTVDHVFLPKDVSKIVPFAVIFVLFDLIYALCMVTHNYVLTLLGQRTLHELRQDLLSKYQAYPLAEFNRTPTGRLVTRLVNDTANLQDLFTSGLGLALGNFSVVIGIVVWLIALYPELGLVCVSVFPLMILSSWFFGGVLRHRFRVSRAALSKLNGYLAENISGMWLIQIFNRQDDFRQRFESVSREYTKAQIHAVRSFAYFQPVITVLGSLSLALLIWYGGLLTLEKSVTLGLLVAFMAYLQALYAPIRDITEKFNLFLSAISSSERIFEFLDRPSEADIDQAPRVRFRGEIEARQLWFQYGEKAAWALQDISFRIPAGAKVGIVGHTGSGKTTLSSLLLRFYEPSRGQILLDGRPLSEIPKIPLRSSIALIQQDPFLFSGTVEDNVFLWQPDKRRIFDLLPSVAKEPFLSGRFPFEREIYEKGANLSAGERQIISFMRALVQDPSILILDEATAHIDSFTEQWISEVSDTAFRDRTVLVIAHRIATLQKMDRIFVFDQGRIVESGTHDELMSRKGVFYRLCLESSKASRQASPTL